MTATYALVGWPLGHSLSPAMHQAAFDALGIDARYVLRPTPPGAFGEVMDALRAGELAGVNVTVPHKVAAALAVEDESGVVRRVGAVNTIVRTPEGFWRGENTDAAGFLHVLRRRGLDDGRGRRAVVLGAGGAARAVGGVLLQAGYAVQILARSSGTAAVAASHLARHVPGARVGTGPLEPAGIVARVGQGAGGATLLVNATPIGSGALEGQSPWPLDVAVPAGVTVIDLVAWPVETVLVRHARASGAAAEGGLEMLVAQAAHAFRLWTGRGLPLETMRVAARAAMGG